MTETRKQQRERILTKRDALSGQERADRSKRIISALKQFLTTRSASYLHCYISFRSEVETREFIEESLRAGLRIVVPVVEELDGTQFLAHTEISGMSELQSGAYGLEQSVERTVANLEQLDAVIVPLSVFDRAGNRLGYGKGFYDRFLHLIPKSIPRIGLAFALQEVTTIEAHSHDEPLDVVITEDECISCSHVTGNALESDNFTTPG